ncbi:hypothetical protein J6590_044088 [Homalodisca vitripennis]|nr:hypothetical protein J6590_044088 [Homalodisca vitripennis]
MGRFRGGEDCRVDIQMKREERVKLCVIVLAMVRDNVWAALSVQRDVAGGSGVVSNILQRVSACRVLSVAVTLARFPSESRWEPSRGDCTYSVKVHGHGSQVPLILLTFRLVTLRYSYYTARLYSHQRPSSVAHLQTVTHTARLYSHQGPSSVAHLQTVTHTARLYSHQGPSSVAHLQTVTHTSRLYSYQGLSSWMMRLLKSLCVGGGFVGGCSMILIAQGR